MKKWLSIGVMKKEEKGIVMIEAIYVIVIAVMIIFFTVNVGVFYHNKLVLTSVANEAANGIAEVYGCIGKEPFYAYTSPGYFGGRNIYRYLITKGQLKETAEKKGKWYASYLTNELEFSAQENLDFSDIEVQCTESDFGVQEVKVTVTRKYPVFVLNPASFFDTDLEYEITAEGNAVCYDMIHQMNSMSLVKELQDKADSKLLLTSSIDTILEMVYKLYGMFFENLQNVPGGNGGGSW